MQHKRGEHVKVLVNPNYNGTGWYDPLSRINFLKDAGVITIPGTANMSNINRYIRLNYLVLPEVEELPIEETLTQVTVLTPNQLLAKAEEEERAKKEAEEIEEKILEEELAKEIEKLEEEIQEIVHEDDNLDREEVQEEAEEETEEEIQEEDSLDCQYCGRTLKSASGKVSHEKSCKQNPNN